jgi:hypothetical protein
MQQRELRANPDAHLNGDLFRWIVKNIPKMATFFS